MARQDVSSEFWKACRDEHKGWIIEVITQFDIVSGQWPVHVFVTRPDGQREKIAVHENIRWSIADAVEHGFSQGVGYVDHLAD